MTKEVKELVKKRKLKKKQKEWHSQWWLNQRNFSKELPLEARDQPKTCWSTKGMLGDVVALSLKLFLCWLSSHSFVQALGTVKHLGHWLGNDIYLVLVLNFLKRHRNGHQNYIFVLSVISLDSTGKINTWRSRYESSKKSKRACRGNEDRVVFVLENKAIVDWNLENSSLRRK